MDTDVCVCVVKENLNKYYTFIIRNENKTDVLFMFKIVRRYITYKINVQLKTLNGITYMQQPYTGLPPIFILQRFNLQINHNFE